MLFIFRKNIYVFQKTEVWQYDYWKTFSKTELEIVTALGRTKQWSGYATAYWREELNDVGTKKKVVVKIFACNSAQMKCLQKKMIVMDRWQTRH